MGEAVKKYKPDFITFEEYLEMEERTEEKHEYHDGVLVPIKAATDRHAEIVINTASTVRAELRKKKSKCRVFDSSLKVYFKAYNHGAYPDSFVICDKPAYFKNKKYAVLNPLLVIEVLSPSTEDYDRGSKFSKYRSLPSFQEYMLVSQDEPKVETWYKVEENLWRISRTEGMEDSIHLYSLKIDLPLSELYYLVDFKNT